MLLQVDNEFQQVKLKDLNEAYNVEMFTTSLRGGKAFAGEQNIRELKTRIAKLKCSEIENFTNKNNFKFCQQHE